MVTTVLVCAGCSTVDDRVPSPANAVYYWRQELRLSATECQWIERHDVRKMYVHLFDVVRRGDGSLQPNATLTVTDLPPKDVEVIPVVFLTHDMMRDTMGLASLPQLLVRRVSAIMEQNDLGPLTELQVDFDWTRTNQMRYFDLLGRIRQALDAHGPGLRLSATIRLHQLQMQPPPVDYGALMVYNVGDLQSPDERCSILTDQAIQPYVRHLSDYRLPLCTALPVYGWDLLFHDGAFSCILHGIDVAEQGLASGDFEPVDSTHYRARRYMPIPPSGITMSGAGRIFPGDVVRHERVPAAELLAVIRRLRRERPSACRQVILYHLDEQQLKYYSDEDIQTIYTQP